VGDGGYATYPPPASDNLGSIALPAGYEIEGKLHSGNAIKCIEALRPQQTGARCTATVLQVQTLPSPPFNKMFAEGNYHMHDFGLFYMNIRANASERSAAYLAR